MMISSDEPRCQGFKQSCRGFVTADVLEKGLSRGAIATGLLEGVKADTKTRGFILVRPHR